MIKKHPAYRYACDVIRGKVIAPKYVKIQCEKFKTIADGESDKYIIDEDIVGVIDDILSLLVVPKGLKAGSTIAEVTVGFQWLLYVAVLCTVHRENKSKRRYETALLEICRKNGKTFVVAVIFVLLLILEPQYSKFYSVAPDGSLSREVQEAIKEIIASSVVLSGDKERGINAKFKVTRDYIQYIGNSNKYIPLNYSNSRMDGKLPNVFLADEVGALPNNYAIEAMRSGQLTILNKLGCVISTKYPTIDNPFESEVSNAKKVLDGIIEDDTVFALLYEPDNTEKDAWMNDDTVLEHSNPLALDIPEIMESLYKKRQSAIENPSKRENFVTKHCNIIYQGEGTETYIPVSDVQDCKVESIDWTGREVYIGVDLAMTNDNCAVAMVANDSGKILAEVVAFIPEGRIEEKSKNERLDYHRLSKSRNCIACGDKTVDYAVIEKFVFEIEDKYNVKILGIGFDRYNALSSAQKWDSLYNTVEVKQHPGVMHPPTKLLQEKITNGEFAYESNPLLEINFQNAKCTYDTYLNRFVSKKKSNGKVDMVVALIIATYMLNENEYLNEDGDWGACY